MSHSPRIRTVSSCSLLVVALVAGTSACGSDNPLSDVPYDAGEQITFHAPEQGKKADLAKPLRITARDGDGRITDVTASDDSGRQVSGKLSADGTRWHSTAPLAAGAHYTLRVSTENADGEPGRKVLTFDTGTPKKKQLLKVAFGPKSGTYGVGEPVVAKLSAPVTTKADRSVVERGLRVDSVPAVDGSWYWVDSKTLHYRPRQYWPAHARIQVHSDLEGIKVGDKLWGTTAKPVKLSTGDRIEAVTDAGSHSMTVFRNGEEIKEVPVTTGKPGFETRNGIKVVLGKEYYVRMRSATVGIAAGSGDSYDLPVYYATRVTWSGEYVHAAPWSVGSQGYANVSHGCTGLSTGDAKWFFNTVREGDIVQVVNSNGEEMDPFGNGFGDWNLDWGKWREGSALLGSGKAPSHTVQAARLRPQV